VRRSLSRPITIAILAVSSLCGTGIGLGPAQAAEGVTTSVDGTVDVIVVDRHDGDHADAVQHLVQVGERRPTLVTTTMVRTQGRTYAIPPSLSRGLRPGQKVRLGVRTSRRPARALALGTPPAASAAGAVAHEQLVTSVTPVRQFSAAQFALRPAAGAHRLTVLPVYWTSPDSQTPTSLTDLAQRTARYWADQSSGGIAITPVVKSWVRIADPGNCDAGALFDRALAAHRQAAPTSLTDHVLIYFPYRSDCGGWAGLGSVSGSRIWVNGYPLLDVTAHEFGHNLGLGHANRATCTAGSARVPLSTSCSVENYQDSADVMGYATWSVSGTLNTALADQLGLVRTVTASPTAPVDLALSPLTAIDQVRAVKVDVGTGWVYIDFRPAQAPDTRRPEWAGVQVHYLPNGSYPQSQLLDLQPWRDAAFQGTSMPAWSVWRVPGSPVAISVGLVGSTARVRAVATTADTTTPSVPTVSVSRPSATTVLASWTTAQDAGSGLAGYRLSVDGAVVGFADPAATSTSLTVASTASSLRVDAVDAAGNVATGTSVALGDSASGGSSGSGSGPGRSLSGADADVTAPNAPMIVSPISGSAVATQTVTWTWNAATDPESAITAYRLYANGTALSTVLPAGVRGVRIQLPAGRATVLGVAAVNAAGLLGEPAETTVTVDTVAPAAVRSLRLLPGTGTLTWAASADTGSPVHFEVTLDGVAQPATSLPRSAQAAATGRHVWRVRAVDAAGNRSPLAGITATVDTSAPSAPSLLAVAAPGSTSTVSPRRTVALSWQAGADPDTGISVYRVRVAGQSVLRTVSGASTRTTLALPDGSSTVSVSAVNAGGGESEPALTQVRIDTTAPSGPRLSAPVRHAASEPLALSWEPSADAQSGVSQYLLTADGRVVARVDGDCRSTSLPAGTVQAGRTVRLALTAVNGAGLRSPAGTALTSVYAG